MYVGYIQTSIFIVSWHHTFPEWDIRLLFIFYNVVTVIENVEVSTLDYEIFPERYQPTTLTENETRKKNFIEKVVIFNFICLQY
ncbi:CLUMA_CG003514, isoform A [Clunio marinus]|uniref:CLUMA_CG003514, isoform A n=1 Tax=Clunio marinus TaxID=568069 RepID=A0A1J1HNU7_9DIPT|nr:CLUMA_CG003514, isoform A [Clunio marinus]